MSKLTYVAALSLPGQIYFRIKDQNPVAEITMEKKRRRRINHTLTLEHRLAQAAKRLRASAHRMPSGPARELRFQKARQMDEAGEMSKFLS
ncbi:hypothetical protein [Bradyrhizobium macuxiense]|uniref:hypothetical protein n=1 Tax=Bradyrhizobium macuxiense TaxID=1755647 RepID=UPI001FD9A38C|nr:hypothetical protein [Bradyrhizobium macuxiense]